MANQEYEIDLLELIIKFWIFIKKNLKLYLLFGVIGLVIGTIYAFGLSKKTYETSMIVTTNLDISDVTDVLKSLTEIIDQADYELLSKEMNLPMKYIESISKIKIETSADTEKEDKKIAGNKIKITLNVKMNTNLDTISYGIQRYVNKNPYVKERYELNKKNILQLITEVDVSIKKLDSLQRSILHGNGKGSQLNIESKPSYHSELMSFFEKKQSLLTSYQLGKPIIIVQGFRTLIQPAQGRLNKVISLSFVFLVIGFLVSLVILFNQKVKQFEKSNQ